MKKLSASAWIVIATLIIWGIWDLVALVASLNTLSEEITKFSYRSISGPLLFGTLGGHFFINKKVNKFSKSKWNGREVGYAYVPWYYKIVITVVFVITAWDVFGEMFDFYYISQSIIGSWYNPTYPLILGIVIGAVVWPAEVLKK